MKATGWKKSKMTMPKNKPEKRNGKSDKPKSPKAIELVGTINKIQTLVDGGYRLAFDIPQSNQKAVCDMIQQDSKGNALFAIAVVKLKTDDSNVIPFDPVDEVISE